MVFICFSIPLLSISDCSFVSYLEQLNNDLCQAAAVGDAKMLGRILSCGVSPNVHGTTLKSTPLHYASKSSSTESAKLLLERAAEIETRDNNNQTDLDCAAWGNIRKFTQLLLERGAEVIAWDNYNQTLLHCATWGNSRESAQLLLERGAEIEARDNINHTPLNLAHSNTGNTKALIHLLVKNTLNTS